MRVVSNINGVERKQMNDIIFERNIMGHYFETISLFHENLIQIFIHEGAIVSCGMEEASVNYLMFVGSQDSLIIDQCVACS